MGVGPSTGMATLGRWRSVLRERHLPWLFTLFLVLALTLESRTGVVNILRGPLFLAVLLCMEGTDLRALWANGPARWFLLLMAWLGLSLLWDGATEEDWKILQRGLQVLTLLMLVFLVGRCRPDWQGRILRLYVIAGLACAVLILQAWPGSPALLTDLYPGLERSHFYTRGVLTISIFTGWMMAVLAIAAGDRFPPRLAVPRVRLAVCSGHGSDPGPCGLARGGPGYRHGAVAPPPAPLVAVARHCAVGAGGGCAVGP